MPRSAWSGTVSSFASTLKPWIVLWNIPRGPIRFGPYAERQLGDDLHLHLDDHEGRRHGQQQQERVVASTKRPRPRISSQSIGYLSTPPMTGSKLAMTAIVSATSRPGMSFGIAWRLMKLGSRIRNRYGFGPPSLMA